MLYKMRALDFLLLYSSPLINTGNPHVTNTVCSKHFFAVYFKLRTQLPMDTMLHLGLHTKSSPHYTI
jgi:hypothetical protein